MVDCPRFSSCAAISSAERRGKRQCHAPWLWVPGLTLALRCTAARKRDHRSFNIFFGDSFGRSGGRWPPPATASFRIIACALLIGRTLEGLCRRPTSLTSRRGPVPWPGRRGGLGYADLHGRQPAADRSSRVYVRRGGWRAAVRSALIKAAQLRGNVSQTYVALLANKPRGESLLRKITSARQRKSLECYYQDARSSDLPRAGRQLSCPLKW